jgi:hypothetical protein
MSGTPLRVGSTLGPYRIDAVVGFGGMADVYRATHVMLDTAVALKVVRADRAHDEEFLRRSLAEQRIYAQLRNPHIVRTLEAGEDDGVTFFAVELVEGVSLADQLSARGPLEPARAAQIVAQIASALDEAHKHGVVHRDVKPLNILVEHRQEGPWVYLQDFGLADAGVGPDWPSIQPGEYAAPEIVRGERADVRSDVWSLGVSLFEMLTGRTPFADKHGMEVLWAILNDPVPSVTTFAPDVPDGFDTVVARATAKDPDARFPSAGALGDAAIEAAGGPPRGAAPDRTHGDGRQTRDILDVGDAKLPSRGSTVRAPSSIFLCYRRDDTRWAAGRLADALRDRFGADSVFVDVDQAHVGNWREQVNKALAESAVVVVLIGPSWLRQIKKRSATEDHVRYEIGVALAHGTIIVPVTVGRARVLDRKVLPPDIAALADQQVYQLGDDRLWRPTVAILLDDLAVALKTAVNREPM